MAEKKIVKQVKLQIPAGKATPAPPVGPALGQAQINIPQFVKMFNDMTQNMLGYIVPVVISVYEDRTFSIVTKTPPASDLLKKAANIQSGAANAKKDKVGTITKAQLEEIAKTKMPDLNAYSVEAAMNIIAGTARQMGITIKE